jgi:hypothetical protein
MIKNGGTDISLMLDKKDVKEVNEFIGLVHALLTEEGKPDEVWGMLRDEFRGQQKKGKILAGSLYTLWQWWEREFAKEKLEGDPYDSYLNAVHLNLGVAPGTADKYVKMWASLFNNPKVPDWASPQLMRMPVETLLLLPSAVNDGLSDDQWRRVTEASTKSTVRQIVIEVRGAPTSGKQAIHLRLKADGSLVAYQGESKPVTLGFLMITTKDLKNDIRRDAIERILRTAGILREG